MNNQRIVQQLEKLIEIGIALSSNIHHNQVLENILLSAKSIANADGGTIYRLQEKRIKIDIILNESLGIQYGGTSENPVSMQDIPLYLEDGSPNLSNVVSYAYHINKTVNIDDAYNDKSFDFSGTKKFDKKNNYRSQSFLTLPLNNHEGEIIGVLQLINATDPVSGSIICFDQLSQRFTEALASQAALILTKQQLIVELEQMFESLIQLIATAIDDKSPYTGGHCRRVPELTLMLAEAAHKTDHGYLKDFAMSEKNRYELKIASWMHDCGKITTPEYVVDKATKLETIFDRIKLLETRYEVLKRDAEITMLKKKIDVLEGKERPSLETIKKEFLSSIGQLEDELNFIRKCNTGSESMKSEDLERIEKIRGKKWFFNNRTQPVLSNDEANNLSIGKGTLNDNERETINRHIKVTIEMLEKINFPKHLKNVPELAGAHHERIDGKGYPRGLKREEMSVPSRCMAIADIFEALTAKDRPYKKAKKLSETLAILEKMKRDNHIDPDLYDVFINEKIYLQYANKFLLKTQIDID